MQIHKVAAAAVLGKHTFFFSLNSVWHNQLIDFIWGRRVILSPYNWIGNITIIAIYKHIDTHKKTNWFADFFYWRFVVQSVSFIRKKGRQNSNKHEMTTAQCSSQNFILCKCKQIHSLFYFVAASFQSNKKKFISWFHGIF